MTHETNGLLPRMEARVWKDGRTVTYRYHPRGRPPVNLGTDREAAMEAAAKIAGIPHTLDPLDPKALHETWARHRKGAKQRGIEFALTQADIQAIVIAQRGRCAITGLGFNTDKPKGLRVRPWLPSLDRTNSRLGYVPGNVRVVCAFVNVAMNGFGEHLFRQVLEPLIALAVEERLRALIPETGTSEALDNPRSIPRSRR